MEPDEARAVAFARWVDERICTRIRPWRFGTLYQDADFPETADSNFLRVEVVPTDVEPADVIAEAGRMWTEVGMGPHRLVVADADIARRLAPAIDGADWRADRFLLLVHRGMPADAGAATEVPLDALLAFRATLASETRGELASDRAYAEKIDRALGTRCFIATIDGRPSSGCVTWVHGADAQLDTVATLPSARGRGAASAAITSAIAAARVSGATWIHLYTDAHSGPVELYRRLGFEVAGEILDVTG